MTGMSKTPTQIQKEVDDHLREMRALEAGASVDSMTSDNAETTYERLSAAPSSRAIHRWIGRCNQKPCMLRPGPT